MTLATKITLIRIVLIPFMAASFLINLSWSPYVTTALFILAASTDWLDGYVARKQNTVTSIGKFLDPIADKILVVVALLLIIENGNGYEGGIIPAPWGSIAVSIIIGREFMVAALRQIAAGNGCIIAADKLGKLKTVTQDIAIPFMFMLPVLVTLWEGFTVVTYVIFAISVILTILSGINYIVVNINVFKSESK
ncbi:MAG: CDP-diacylglycerol--glycerol-3-phosphate 3-phosphatidyltransferase [Christensenellales bacterium]